MRRDELKHFGIQGQKWGIRRWQNADGSFNEEGKKRYGRIGTRRQKIIDKRAAGREQYIAKETKDIEKIKKEISEQFKELNELNIKGVNSKFFKEQLYKDIENNETYFVNSNPKYSRDSAYSTKQEAFEELYSSVRRSIMENADLIKQGQANIELLKNAKLTDRTFLENVDIARNLGTVAGTASMIGAGALSFKLGAGLIGALYLAPIAGFSAYMVTTNKAENIGVKKKNRKPKINNTTDEDLHSEYERRYKRKLREQGEYHSVI